MKALGRIITIHSFKGGTGKTLIATNLAASLARTGTNVCLLDMDFRAPSLQLVFQTGKPQFWLNDFFNGKCEIDEVLIDLNDKFRTRGHFFVAYADSSIEAMQQVLIKDRKQEMKALQRLLGVRNRLFDEMKIDSLIIDSSPGVQYSSLNAIVASDVTLVVSTNDEADIEGTRRMIKDLYEAFEKKTEIIVNRALCEGDLSGRESEKIYKHVEETFGIRILGIVPVYCDLLKTRRTAILSFEKPSHPFVETLKKVSDQLQLSQAR